MSWASMAEFAAVLQPYFNPPTCRLKFRAYACFLLLGLGKACNIAAPIPLAAAVDEMTTRFPWEYILAFVLLRIGSSVFSELQRLAYLPVAEAAYTVIADRVFTHVTELSLQWHTSKRTGAVMRALDRGLNSASTIVNQLFLRLGPTVVELIVLCIIAAVSFDALAPALCLLAGFVVYAVATVRMTAWRREIRAKMLKQDNTASQIAADALGNAEAVKTFANEEYEQRRYADAVAAYQRSLNRSQGSLTVLNASQQVIIASTLLAVLLFSAYDVSTGSATIGRFVLLQTMTLQTFAPLGFLGTIWSMLNTAFTDLINLLALLKQEPDVADAPGAPRLALAWKSERDVREAAATAAAPAGGAGAGAGSGGGVALPGAAASEVAPAQAQSADDPEAIESAHVAVAVIAARKQAAATAAGDDAEGATGGSSPTPAGAGSSPTVEFRDVWFAYGVRGATGGKHVRSVTGKLHGGPAADQKPRGAAESDAGAALRQRGAATPAAGAAAADVAEAKGVPAEGDAEAAGGSTGQMVLRGVSFTVPAGTSTAIVGPSGAGKSSIAKLIFRLYDVSRGSVLVGGEDVRSVRVRSLRSQLGMVSQDTTLFNASLAHNIRYGAASDTRVTTADIEAAARRAALWPLIERLPKGLDTVVGERGLQLSGGERQRTAIARTLLRDPPILIADEYSSALDSATEAEVARTMAAAARGRTLVVIAHRLSTAMHCDQIIVLDAGEVVERGSHAELLAKEGAYARMWRLQAQQGRGEDVDTGADAAEGQSTGEAGAAAGPAKAPAADAAAL